MAKPDMTNAKKDVLVVVDMQQDMLLQPRPDNLTRVVDRINKLAASVRRGSGTVIFVHHCGPAREPFDPASPGWQLLPGINAASSDLRVRKHLNSPFAGTDLDEMLTAHGAQRLIITGWATDFCVDATVRDAVARGYRVEVAADGHTCANRPHLNAAKIIEHHQWLWRNLIAEFPVRVRAARDICAA